MPDWKQYIRSNLHLRGVRPAREADFVDDLAQQLEDAYREARASGMAEADAIASARRHISDWDTLRGELERLPHTAVPALARVEGNARGLFRDLLFGLRMMRKNPGFTLVVVLTLALGIGAAATMFGIVNAVLLRPLPYPNASRVAVIQELARLRNRPEPELVSVSWQDYQDWRKQIAGIEALGVYRLQNANLTRVDPPERLRVSMTSADVFRAIGVRPVLGRAFVAAEDQPGAASTVVLGESLCRNRFAAARDILGRAITLDGVNYTVVGVMPDSMRFPARVDAWLPIGPFVKDMPRARGAHPNLTAVALVRPGASIRSAQVELDAVAARLAGQYPDSNADTGVRVQSLYEVTVGRIQTNLLVLLGAVAFVLLIACVNIANLMLARGEMRLREVAVRRALGASRSRLVRQLLTESALLALGGALLGSGLAWLCLTALVKSKPTSIPRIDQVGMDGVVLAFTCLLALLVAALFGLWPALRITAPVPRTFSTRSRLRPFLVAAEAGLATMLLIGASLLARTFTHLTRVELGFHPERVLTLRVGLPARRYPSPEQAAVFYRDLLARVSSLPGVAVAGISTLVPLSGGGAESGILPEGTRPDRDHPGPGCTFGAVSGGYFRAMGIDFVRGRTFNEHDGPGNSPVIVIDEAAALAFWPGQDPIGKRVSFETRNEGGADPQTVWREVVGVVRRVRHYDLTGTTARVQVYTPYTQPPIYYRNLPAMALMVRTETEPAALAASIRREAATLDSDLPVYQVRTMTEYVDSNLEQPRLSMAVLAAFGALGLLLAAVGIYGVLSYAVSQRTREIGIRMALGASRASVLRAVIAQGALISAAGVAAGVAGSLAAMRLLRGLLFAVTPTDLPTYIAIPCVLFAVALGATLIPARRATKVEPDRRSSLRIGGTGLQTVSRPVQLRPGGLCHWSVRARTVPPCSPALCCQ
jgi:putative ABC transport system permease protein